MAYIFWILVGVFLAYILPVSWHLKFRNWLFSKIRKKPKPEVKVDKKVTEEPTKPKEVSAKEL